MAREEEMEEMFEATMTENFPTFMKDTKTQIQETQNSKKSKYRKMYT